MDKLFLSPVPLEALFQEFRSIVKEELRTEQLAQLQEKLLSPAETCKLFQPEISTVTLSKWTKDGRLQPHRIGGRIYYKYSEVMSSLHALKKYSRTS